MAKAPTCQNCGASHWSTQACKNGVKRKREPVAQGGVPGASPEGPGSSPVQSTPASAFTHGGARPGAGRPRKYFTDEEQKQAARDRLARFRAKRQPYINDA